MDCAFFIYEHISKQFDELALKSLKSFLNLNLNIHIYCFYKNEINNKLKISDKIIFKNIDIYNFDNLHYVNTSKYNHIVDLISFKLLALSILKKQYDKVIYFDLDVIFRKDFSYIIKSLNNSYIYGCNEYSRKYIASNRCLVLRDAKISLNQYINAGFMIWCLDFEFDIEDYKNYIKKFFVDCPEQDYINFKFKNYIKVLPNYISWNPLLDFEYNPACVHFLGEFKPYKLTKNMIKNFKLEKFIKEYLKI